MLYKLDACCRFANQGLNTFLFGMMSLELKHRAPKVSLNRPLPADLHMVFAAHSHSASLEMDSMHAIHFEVRN